MTQLNSKVIKSIFPLFGIVFGIGFALAGFRTFGGWVLGSGIFGAVPLAALTVIAVLAIAIVIINISIKSLGKTWNVQHNHNH